MNRREYYQIGYFDANRFTPTGINGLNAVESSESSKMPDASDNSLYEPQVNRNCFLINLPMVYTEKQECIRSHFLWVARDQRIDIGILLMVF